MCCSLNVFSDYKRTPAVYKGPEGETTVIDRVILCSDTNDKLSIKFIIRHTRRPEASVSFKSYVTMV